MDKMSKLGREATNSSRVSGSGAVGARSDRSRDVDLKDDYVDCMSEPEFRVRDVTSPGDRGRYYELSPMTQEPSRQTIQRVLERRSPLYQAVPNIGLNKDKKSIRFTTDMYVAYNVTVNSTAGKYLQFIGGVSQLPWKTIVPACSELTQLATLFSQAFVHYVEIAFHPINKYSSNASASSAAAGQPGFLNTCGAVISYSNSNQAAVSDSSTAAVDSMACQRSKWVDLADSFSFKGVNEEKFAWDGPMSDQSTSGSAQGWLTTGSMNTALGGAFQLATISVSAAAGATTTLLDSGLLGHAMMRVRASFRSRF